MRGFRNAWLRTTVVAAAAALGAATITWAHGGDGSKIHTCVDGDDYLYVIPANGSCDVGETNLDWSIGGGAGTPGPAGPAGPAGPQGPQGPAGKNALASVSVPTAATRGAATRKRATARCAGGAQAIGGGHQLGGRTTGVTVVASRPVTSGGKASGWYAEASAAGGQWTLTAYAVCAGGD